MKIQWRIAMSQGKCSVVRCQRKNNEAIHDEIVSESSGDTQAERRMRKPDTFQGTRNEELAHCIRCLYERTFARNSM